MKILIVVPTFDTIQPEVFKAIYNLRPAGNELSFDIVRGHDVAVARNEIAMLAQREQCDYCLMVDSDTLIPADTLELMLEDPVDICLGVCPRKNTKNGFTAMVKLDAEHYGDCYYYSDLPAERTKVKGGGFACALVKTTVFTMMDNPWFQYTTNEDGSTFGEDFYFCQNARFMGYDIWMDPRVRCGHLARFYQFD